MRESTPEHAAASSTVTIAIPRQNWGFMTVNLFAADNPGTNNDSHQ